MENLEEDNSGKNYDEYIEWLRTGIDKKFISTPFCFTHDGDPFMTQEEGEQWNEGGDPCAFVVKLIIETGYNEDTKYKEETE